MNVLSKLTVIAALVVSGTLIGCTKGADQQETQGAAAGSGQSGVTDDVSAKDIVKVAVGSKDHTTLVKALQAAELVDAMSNAGPFTVFAPTDEAFSKIPAETLAELMKPENKDKLADVLYHHVQVSVYDVDRFTDGTTMMMFDSKPEKVEVKDGVIKIGGAKILGTVRASNGIVHVVDAVILAD
jgi:uncharacterized surface protein with fasciclin (FAS1) repeats